MTTTTSVEEHEKSSESSSVHNVTSGRSAIPTEIINIMDYLSQNASITFKSQQREEPELQQTEKFKFALNIYRRNPQTFLMRFGNYLEEKHLVDFGRLAVANSDKEMHLMVKDYQYKLRTRQRDIKNRRYTALQRLIKDGEYFSEQEMMKRQPELYQELVGQYLSSKEKQQRDSYDVRNTTFSGILMHNLEQKQLSEIMERVENNGKEVTETTSSSSSDNLEIEQNEIPLDCRQQWGNFDNEQIACSSSKLRNKKSPGKSEVKRTPVVGLITADERELLRQEFVSQMHEQFLTGQDKDFDYAAVDNSTQYDDLNLLNQDEEDKYFEESDEDDTHNTQELQQEYGKSLLSNEMKDSNESEDELDAYMSHLNKHHSLQKYIQN